MLLSAILGMSTGCQQGTQQTSDKFSSESVWAYIPEDLESLGDAVGIGPRFHFVNIAKVREDLGIPPITGTNNRQEKLDLIVGLDAQGLEMFPDEIDPSNGSAFDMWGWDIADIQQLLYLPDLQTAVIFGGFEREQIREHLLEKEYTSSEAGSFTLYTNPNSEIQFALKNDTILVSSSAESNLLETLIQTFDMKMPSLSADPAVQALLAQQDEIWGAFLMPSNNLAQFTNDLLNGSIAQLMNSSITSAEIGWDFMSITFYDDNDASRLTFKYHYPSNNEARKDEQLVEMTLTETQSLFYRNQTWGELMELETVERNGNVIVVNAVTANQSLVGDSFENRDYYGFIPIRYFEE
jgi:hypothetical protein